MSGFRSCEQAEGSLESADWKRQAKKIGIQCPRLPRSDRALESARKPGAARLFLESNSTSDFGLMARRFAVIHEDSAASIAEQVRLAADDGVFELAGSPPAWISVLTCPIHNCQCRTALVLSADGGREELFMRGATVHDAWEVESGYREAAGKLDDGITFFIDIDTTAVYSLNGETPIDLAEHPRIAAIANRIDGDLLDSIGSQWYRGKDLPDPEQRLQDISAAKLIDWLPGNMVAWTEICDVRQDLYVLDGRRYEASEMYCPIPTCDCAKVFIGFDQPNRRGAPSAGHVVVTGSGAAELFPRKNGGDRLQRLWNAFRQRHPNYLARFERRYPKIKTVGELSLNRPILAAPKIGRNQACPCGSGKKYKRCCGAS